MSAGELREKLRFESPAPVDDGYGNETAGWTAEFKVWAGLRNLKGGEDVMAERLEGRQPVVIRVRRSARTLDIRSDWRAVHVASGVVYQLKAPPADMTGARAYLDILAESGVAA